MELLQKLEKKINSELNTKINSSKDKMWHIYERVALGNENKIIKINISKKKDSSSVLKIKKKHLKKFWPKK